MMKKISIFVMAFMLSLFVSGCEEVENKDGMETGSGVETSLVEKVDLSAVSAPEEAMVYSALFFDREPEETARIFLGSDFEEGETSALGRMFLSGAGTKEEKMLYAYDSGRAFYGDIRVPGSNGVVFHSRYKILYNKIYENNDEYDRMKSEYCNEGRISDEGSDGQDGVFSDKQKLVSENLEKLGARGYGLYSAGMFNVDKTKGCLMYFKQMVDGIPVSHIGFANIDKMIVYNFRHSIVGEKTAALNADVEVCFLGDELVEFSCQSLINADRQLKKYPLVPVNTAYEKVKKCYPADVGTDGKYELERAELQYELVMPDYSYEKIYLYPVWLFGVRNKGGGEMESEWTYYIVDAVTGEFFSNIPEEFLQ